MNNLIRIKVLHKKIDDIWEELDNYNHFLEDMGIIKKGDYIKWAMNKLQNKTGNLVDINNDTFTTNPKIEPKGNTGKMIAMKLKV